MPSARLLYTIIYLHVPIYKETRMTGIDVIQLFDD